jgi:hypothetical protein
MVQYIKPLKIQTKYQVTLVVTDASGNIKLPAYAGSFRIPKVQYESKK